MKMSMSHNYFDEYRGNVLLSLGPKADVYNIIQYIFESSPSFSLSARLIGEQCLDN